MNRKLLSEQPLRTSFEDLENMNFLNNNFEESPPKTTANHVLKFMLLLSFKTILSLID